MGDKVKLLETCAAGQAGEVVEVEDAGWFFRRGWAEPVEQKPVSRRETATSKKASRRKKRGE